MSTTLDIRNATNEELEKWAGFASEGDWSYPGDIEAALREVLRLRGAARSALAAWDLERAAAQKTLTKAEKFANAICNLAVHDEDECLLEMDSVDRAACDDGEPCCILGEARAFTGREEEEEAEQDL